MANYWEEEEKKRPKMDWRNAPDSGSPAEMKKRAAAKKMTEKKLAKFMPVKPGTASRKGAPAMLKMNKGK